MNGWGGLTYSLASAYGCGKGAPKDAQAQASSESTSFALCTEAANNNFALDSPTHTLKGTILEVQGATESRTDTLPAFLGQSDMASRWALRHRARDWSY